MVPKLPYSARTSSGSLQAACQASWQELARPIGLFTKARLTEGSYASACRLDPDTVTEAELAVLRKKMEVQCLQFMNFYQPGTSGF